MRSVDFPELSPISMSGGVSRLCIVLHQRLYQCGFPNTCNVPGLSRPDSPRITRVPAWRSLNHHDERWWHLDKKNQEQHIPSSNRRLPSPCSCIPIHDNVMNQGPSKMLKLRTDPALHCNSQVQICIPRTSGFLSTLGALSLLACLSKVYCTRRCT